MYVWEEVELFYWLHMGRGVCSHMTDHPLAPSTARASLHTGVNFFIKILKREKKRWGEEERWA